MRIKELIIQIRSIRRLDRELQALGSRLNDKRADIDLLTDRVKELTNEVEKLPSKVEGMRAEESKYGKYFEERCHMENLLNTRFNYLLILFGLIVGGLTIVKSESGYFIITSIGTVIILLMTWVIARAQKRLNFLLEYLEGHDGAVKDAKSKLDDLKFFDPRHYSVKNIMGYWLPILFSIAMIFSLINPSIIQNALQDKEESINRGKIDSLTTQFVKEKKLIENRIISLENKADSTK